MKELSIDQKADNEEHSLKKMGNHFMTRMAISLFVLLLLSQCVQKATQTAKVAEKPKFPRRLLLLVIDYPHPGILTPPAPEEGRALERIRKDGIYFSNATVGHLSVAPVVSYLSLSSGLFPKKMIWQDPLLKDAKGILGVRNAFYAVQKLEEKQLSRLSKKSGAFFLSNALEAFHVTESKDDKKETPVPSDMIAIGRTSNEADLLGGISSKKKRFVLNTKERETIGGASLVNYMKKYPQWRGLFATLDTSRETLDSSLGTLLNYLEESALLQETLVVVTALSGSKDKNADTVFFGNIRNTQSAELPPALKTLQELDLIEAGSMDTSWRFWLKKTDPSSILRFSKILKSIPEVAEIYIKQHTNKSTHYIRSFRSGELKGFALDRAKEKNLELLESLAADNSPDVFTVLNSQANLPQDPQSIPLFILSPYPSHRGKVVEDAVTLTDLTPMILKLMGQNIPDGLDGSSGAVDKL